MPEDDFFDNLNDFMDTFEASELGTYYFQFKGAVQDFALAHNVQFWYAFIGGLALIALFEFIWRRVIHWYDEILGLLLNKWEPRNWFEDIFRSLVGMAWLVPRGIAYLLFLALLWLWVVALTAA